ncbi:unnamed protein product, partial [Thlaspi arvense]
LFEFTIPSSFLNSQSTTTRRSNRRIVDNLRHKTTRRIAQPQQLRIDELRPSSKDDEENCPAPAIRESTNSDHCPASQATIGHNQTTSSSIPGSNMVEIYIVCDITFKDLLQHVKEDLGMVDVGEITLTYRVPLTMESMGMHISATIMPHASGVVCAAFIDHHLMFDGNTGTNSVYHMVQTHNVMEKVLRMDVLEDHSNDAFEEDLAHLQFDILDAKGKRIDENAIVIRSHSPCSEFMFNPTDDAVYEFKKM